MGKTSKFSFPLPGRKQRSNNRAQAGGSPQAAEPKLSKAERLLGATGLPVNNLPQNQRQQDHVYSDLRKEQSSLTLTVYEPSLFEDVLDFEPPIPDIDTMPALPDFSSSPDAKILRHAEPLPRSMSLNQKSVGRTTPDKKGHPRSFSNGSVPSARQFKSEDNLKNQYQLKAFPSISEKSSIPKVSPPRNSERTTMNNYSPWESVDPKQQPNLSSASPTKANQTERKRPSRLDLTKLFPKNSSSRLSGFSHTLVSSPTSVFSAPHTESYMTRMSKPELRSPVGSAKHNKLTKAKPEQWHEMSMRVDTRPKTAGETNPRANFEHNIHPMPISVGRNMSSNTKNWFDGLLEAEDAIDLDMDDEEENISVTDIMEDFTSLKYNSNVQDKSIRVVNQSSPMRPSPVLPNSMDTRLRRLSWQGNHAQSFRASITESQIKRASIHSTMQSPNLSTSIQSRNSVITLNTPVQASYPTFVKPQENTQEQENESEADDEEFFDVRDSIALSDLDEEICIGEAQAFHVKTGHFVGSSAKSPQFAELRQSISHQMVPALQSPRDVMHSMKSAEEYQDRPVATGLAITRPDHIASPMLSPQSISNKSLDSRHKLMAVTEEEEALLEMMRQKRAAMASHNFAAGYKTALMSSPQSPMFMNAKRESSGASTRSRSSRPGPSDYKYDNIDPPLSPPPTDVLPPPPGYLYDESDRSLNRHNVQSMMSSTSVSATNSNTASLVIANLEPSYSQLSRNSTESTGQQLGSGFQYNITGSPAVSSGSGLSLSLSHSSTNGSGPSALPSPITPRAHNAAGLDLVMIANNSSRGSDASMDEMREHHQTELSFKNPSHSQTASFQSMLHRTQPSTNTVINLDGHENSVDIERETHTNTDESPKSAFEERMAEIRSKTMAATLAATKAYSINTIRRKPRLLNQQEEGEQMQTENAPSREEEAISHPSSPTHVHSGSGCCAHLDTRCSVADDVMQAWNSLGGWSGIDKYSGYATAGQA